MKITEEQHFGGPYYNFQGATIQKLVINSNVNKKGKKRHHNKCAQKPKQEHTDEEKKEINSEQLARAIENCQKYFWGNSSYAVVFCIYRDDYKVKISQTDFEMVVENLPFKIHRDYQCTTGTISNAFSNNPIFN